MLFNSYTFIFFFLPVVFIGAFWLGKQSHRLACLWLVLSSFVFYAAWDARYVLFLLASISFNYAAAYRIGLMKGGNKDGRAKYALMVAVAVDLCLLGYFKYANFFIGAVDQISGLHIQALQLILPLGISFFTFTQIAFLVDVYRGIAREYNFIHYLLFVTYFPHLIAGPILHHRQMMPQFANPATFRINMTHVAVGLTIFVLGLAKKVLIADSLAEFATPIFNAARDGAVLMFFEAWIGALSYSLQLYFDFSGYSDMAIGLSLMFNIRLPQNFDSPYKATSIIDFWRRWHMTLSAFLREYLYFPLGGNRRGPLRRYLNLLATMLLGGLWHGAGWTFLLWGGLHGLYLMINHGWRELKARLAIGAGGRIAQAASVALTFVAVVVAWVFFRADGFSSAWAMLSGMAGMNGVSLSSELAGKLPAFMGTMQWLTVEFKGLVPVSHVGGGPALFSIACGLLLVWFFPNVRQIFTHYQSTWDDQAGVQAPSSVAKSWLALRFSWRPSLIHAWVLGVFFGLSILGLTQVSEFIYFQF